MKIEYLHFEPVHPKREHDNARGVPHMYGESGWELIYVDKLSNGAYEFIFKSKG